MSSQVATFYLGLLVAVGGACAMDLEVVYRTVDDAALRLDVVSPEGPGPFPAVVCLHGGGWSMGNKRSFRESLDRLATSGYVAAAIQYRLAPRYRFPAQLEDVREAVRFLRANATRWKVDRSKVAVMGASAGAHLALLFGFLNAGAADAVQAVIDISGPTDLRDWRMNTEVEDSLKKSTGKTTDALLADFLGDSSRSSAIIAEASPVLRVSRAAPPVLIFQWTEDRAVPSEQAERLANALKKAGVQHEVVWFEGRGHALNGPGVREIVPRTVKFLNALFGLQAPSTPASSQAPNTRLVP